MNYREPLSPLDVDTDKYKRGKLVCIAGSATYTGAAVLAACASERMGAGYTEVYTVPEAQPIVRAASPSLVVRTRSEGGSVLKYMSMPRRPFAICIGPGFEGSGQEKELLREVLETAECPVLIDGGALVFLAFDEIRDGVARRCSNGLPTVITPHLSEATRIVDALGVKFDKGDPERFAQQLASYLKCIVVLKGPDTFISDGETVIPMTDGTPVLAKAGSGDVLAGMIGALLAQYVDPIEAAVVGATIHARAGVLAAEELTEIAVIASDLIDFIPLALAEHV